MFLVRLKKANGQFKKDGVYIFDNENVKRVPPSYGEVYPFDDLPTFNGQPNLILLRSGGIGDLMAYSILHDVCPNIIFITQAKYRPFMKLWETKPKFNTPNDPVFFARDRYDMIKKMQLYGRLNGIEDAIELGSTRNWYEIIEDASTIHNKRRRPCIVKPDAPFIPGCLIVSKSSVTDRTANHTDILEAVKPFYNNIVLSHEQQWTEQQYIEALAGFEMVISVDTSAIHIREGFKLPALGLYGAFVKECRTSGYEYTDSIQINQCSPCQRHSRIPCKVNKGTSYAPCLSGQVMINQIREYFESKQDNEIHTNISAIN